MDVDGISICVAGARFIMSKACRCHPVRLGNSGTAHWLGEATGGWPAFCPKTRLEPRVSQNPKAKIGLRSLGTNFVLSQEESELDSTAGRSVRAVVWRFLRNGDVMGVTLSNTGS